MRCPRCSGSVLPQRTLDGIEYACIMCGFVVTTDKGLAVLLRRLLTVVVE